MGGIASGEIDGERRRFTCNNVLKIMNMGPFYLPQVTYLSTSYRRHENYIITSPSPWETSTYVHVGLIVGNGSLAKKVVPETAGSSPVSFFLTAYISGACMLLPKYFIFFFWWVEDRMEGWWGGVM